VPVRNVSERMILFLKRNVNLFLTESKNPNRVDFKFVVFRF
jgi:hypothetical protein